MTKHDKRPTEGVLREEAGRADAEGFIAPEIGVFEHALYFTTAPSVTEKARQVFQEGRLLLPGVVVVWDETVGRRKAAKAIPKSWWAGAGSLTAAFAFQAGSVVNRLDCMRRAAGVVVRVLESFQPSVPVGVRPPNDLLMDGKKVGALFLETNSDVDLIVVRLNCVTDFSKAPPSTASSASRLIDFIDVCQLPLQKAGTLPNAILTRLMAEMPGSLA